MMPRVFGIKNDSRTTIQIKSTDWSLMDAGANICLTGDPSILANAANIPPLPTTVAINGNGSPLDDCCTKKGYIPLTLSNGTMVVGGNLPQSDAHENQVLRDHAVVFLARIM